MLRRRTIITVLLILAFGCREGQFQPSGVKQSYQHPSTHALPAPAYPADRDMPLVPKLKAPPPSSPLPSEPKPTEKPTPVAAPSTTEVQPPAPPQKASEEETQLIEEDPTKLEALDWLEDMNREEPGCLLSGILPNVKLPSPKTLVYILTEQPNSFTGVAREGLVCLLKLPQVTKAEVYGRNAFRDQAKSADINLVGSSKAQGVLAMLITTDHPRAGGTFVAAFDQRDEEWVIRESTFIPWTHSHRGHQLLAIKSTRTLSRNRRTLILQHRNDQHTIHQYVALTSTEEWKLLLEATVAEKQADGTRVKASLRTQGRGWPRQVVHRAIIRTPNVPNNQFAITYWKTVGETPYTAELPLNGEVTLDGAHKLYAANQLADAEWVVSVLPRKLRRSPKAYVLLAQIAAAGNRHKKAKRRWKRALKYKRKIPEVERDHAIYLLSRKKTEKGLKGLRNYLKARPNAVDRADVEAMIQSYEVAP